MTDEEFQKLVKRLEDHESRIRILEGINTTDKRPLKNKTKTNSNKKGKGEDLFPPIQTLVKNDFFKDEKIDLDVVLELQRKLLTQKKPLRASVVNVLRRMVRGGILERTEIVRGKKTLIAYKNS